MAELNPLRALSIEKARNLYRNAQVALKDAKAPADYVSATRRFDAAYDCGLACALLVLECNKFEIIVNEQALLSAIEWAERVLAETENWVQTHQPLALK